MRARSWAHALFLWLALATVLVPALASSGSPLRMTEGSAFSAFTSNVSLGPSRPAPVEQDESARAAPGDGTDGATHAAIASSTPIQAIVLPLSGRSFADPSPPRPARIAAGPIGARAPPLA